MLLFDSGPDTEQLLYYQTKAFKQYCACANQINCACANQNCTAGFWLSACANQNCTAGFWLSTCTSKQQVLVFP